MKNKKNHNKSGVRFRESLKPTLLLGILLSLILAVLLFLQAFDFLENKVLDRAFQMRSPIAADPRIITLDIDDASIGVVGRWPWPWNVHALAADFLALYGAENLTFVDMDFSRENDLYLPAGEADALRENLKKEIAAGAAAEQILPDHSRSLYKSIGENGRAFFSFTFKFPVTSEERKNPHRSAAKMAKLFTAEKQRNLALLKGRVKLDFPPGPYSEAVDIDPPLAGITENAAGAGFNTIITDDDGVVRRYPLVTGYDGAVYPSLALRWLMDFTGAKQATLRRGRFIEIEGKKSALAIPVGKKGEMLVNWAGGYADTFVRMPFNLAASFMALEAAKKELAGYSLTALQDPMALQGIITDRLRRLRILTEDQCRYTGAVVFVSFIVEYYLRNSSYALEEILASLGINPKDELWLNMGREVALNNMLAAGYERGKPPAFDELVKSAGYVLNEASRTQLKSSYDQTLYFLEKGALERARPLYFGPPVTLAQGNKKLTVTPLTFRGKSIFYGLTATGLTSQDATPFMERHPMLDLAPNVVNTVITGRLLVPLHGTAVVISFILLFALLFAAMYLSPAAGFIVLGLTGTLYGAGAWFAFTERGYILSVIPPFFAMGMAYISSLILRYFQEQKERKKVRGMFSTMVSPEVLKIMEDNPDVFRMAGERREATMFSSDVSGFTNISEGVTARELANILNIYLTPMSNIIMSYNGYVDKYEGDAIKAEFGVPLADPGHSWKACFAALYQQEELKIIQRMILLKYGVKITARMGVNTGIVSAGNMGSEKRMQYTVMGEAATLAEELEPANKLFESWIAIGPETLRRAGDAVEVRYLNNLIMGPAHQSLPVYELAGWKKERFLEFWEGKPVPELALASFAGMLPEKVIACQEYYAALGSGPPLLADLQRFFGELKDRAVAYMKLRNAASVLTLREDLALLQTGLAAHRELYDPAEAPAQLLKEASDLEAMLAGEERDWNRVLLQWRAELKKCAGAHRLLCDRIDRDEADRYFALIDVLEKSVMCLYMRITFPSPEDLLALEMADHLRSLLQGKDGDPAGKGRETLEEEAGDIETEIRRRLSAFAEELKGRAGEYHRLLADLCLVTEEKRRVMSLYERGRAHYLKREWDGAEEAFRQALDILPSDGPSFMFMKKIAALRKNPPPPSWDGAWEEE